jgi:HK97 gp10 family phage protein
MKAKFQIDGMKALYAYFQALPDDVKEEARGIVHAAAEAAYRDVYAALPVVTGYLRSQLRVVAGEPSPTEALSYLENTARYAAYVEFGTHDTPPHNSFYPPVLRHRLMMWLALSLMVQKKGLTVTGSADLAA